MSLPKIVRGPILAAFRIVSKVSIALHAHKYRYVFILAHMRSGSSLLAHIMASHPDFVGAGETYTSYRSSADLPNLVLRTSEALHKPILRGPYVVDKINWNHFLADEVLQTHLLCKCVILIRDPETTLKSLIERGMDPNDELFGYHEKKALEYYTNRLDVLTRYGLLLGERALLVEYDELIGRTEDTLATLTRFFGVDPGFTPTYATHRATGRLDDTSINIRAGRIICTADHQVAVSQDSLIAASIAFRQCRKRLEAAAVRVVGCESSLADAATQ